MPKVTTKEIVNTMLRNRLPEPSGRGEIFRLAVVRDACVTAHDGEAVPTRCYPTTIITLRAVEWHSRFGVRRLEWEFDNITGD